jgi:hypothetical protein
MRQKLKNCTTDSILVAGTALLIWKPKVLVIPAFIIGLISMPKEFMVSASIIGISSTIMNAYLWSEELNKVREDEVDEVDEVREDEVDEVDEACEDEVEDGVDEVDN